MPRKTPESSLIAESDADTLTALHLISRQLLILDFVLAKDSNLGL